MPRKRPTEKSLKNLMPPVKKGEIRNPKGRPKGSRDRATILREILVAMVKDGKGKNKKNPLTGAKEMNYEEAVDVAIVKRAIGGSIEAIREIKDTLHGRLADKKEISGPDGGPVIIIDDIPKDK